MILPNLKQLGDPWDTELLKEPKLNVKENSPTSLDKTGEAYLKPHPLFSLFQRENTTLFGLLKKMVNIRGYLKNKHMPAFWYRTNINRI